MAELKLGLKRICKKTISSLFVCFYVSICGHLFSYAQDDLLHLPPDLDGQQYYNLIQKLNAQKKKINKSNDFKGAQESPSIDMIMRFGERNLKWLEHLNKNREKKLEFSNPGNRNFYPVETPYIYNEEIILNRFKALLLKLPESMKSVLLSDQDFPNELPLSEEDYINFGRQSDGVYQGASRWLLLSPYIYYLEKRKSYDIRGFYHLTKIEDIEDQLKHFKWLKYETQNQYIVWLVDMCVNTVEDIGLCEKELDKELIEDPKNAYMFYLKYFSGAQDRYKSFFEIPYYAVRTDIDWNASNSNVATVPFLDPNDENIRFFLKNIEDEWRYGSWNLRLNFTNKDAGVTPRVIFTPGETPHVNGIGGYIISMDANSPLSEYDNQWTIRHEFGHVLGFPDCYVEFYDSSVKAIINYQIDVDNLMCSRKGKLKETHYNEMKKNYFRF